MRKLKYLVGRGVVGWGGVGLGVVGWRIRRDCVVGAVSI
jgi:hypothetical protein